MAVSARVRPLEPFSASDTGLCLLLFSAAVAIWYAGDFHTFHYSDDLIHSLNSLYRWTPLSWESDHIGSLLPLLVSFIRRPYWNVLAISTLSSFLFLGGLTLWTSLLASRQTSLAESAVWVLLLLPLVVTRHRIFDNASHGSTFGAAFFFAGLFVHALESYLTDGYRSRRLPLLLCCGFLTVYLSKTALIPLGVVTLCMIYRRVRAIAEQSAVRNNLLSIIAPALCLGLALLAYQVLELTAPAANDFTPSLSNIPASLPRLLANWNAQELTTRLWVLAPLGLSFYRPSNPLLVFLAAGAAVEAIVVSSSRWVSINGYSGYYLTDLTFLLLLAIVFPARHFVRRLTPSHLYPRLLPVVTAAALFVNAREWNSFSPVPPFAAMDGSIGVNTASIVEADCDILAGDYWKVWPAALAANDYYYRNSIADPRTGKIRLVAGLSLRARPVEYLWRPRLDWPDVRLCAFERDDELLGQTIAAYILDVAAQITPMQQTGPLKVYRIERSRFSTIDFEFDRFVPGVGWSGPEVSPDGDTFVWAAAATSTLLLSLETSHDLQIEFRVLYSMAPDIVGSLTLSVNDQPVTLTPFPDNGGAIFSGLIPRSILDDNARHTVVTFHVNRTLVPQLVLPGSSDPRTLSLAFDWLRIEPADVSGG